ncbi:MAG: PP2C family protein-serine/threonine phosphatase [Phycisphaerales bacterium]
MNQERLSITDFLTDGSLAALCEVATAITRRTVRLRDPDERLILTRQPDEANAAPWQIRDNDATPERAAAVAGRAGLAASVRVTPSFVAPIVVDGEVIGSFSVDPPDPDIEAGVPEPEVQRFAVLLAALASEVCESAFQQRERNEELAALLKLSSMLVAAGDADETLATALHAAVELLGADAGTIRTLDESRENLVLRAYTGLSDEYIASAAVLPAAQALDPDEFRGGVVCIPDLPTDARTIKRPAIKSEGLRSLISAGLAFRGRPLGVMRLYTRAPREFTDRERSLLKSIAQHSSTAVASTQLIETELDHRRMLRQVQLAAQVQGRMLPRTAPEIPNLDIAARHLPSLELSGDFYDLLDLADLRTDQRADASGPRRLGLLIGDVVGKGVAAALLMASVRASLRAHVQDLPDLDEVMNRVNAAMCRDTLESEFATVFYGVLDASTLRLTYCNAGHDFPFVVRARADGPPREIDIDELSTGGMVIGVDGSQRYQSASFDLRLGDTLIMYTDGLSDTMAFDGHRFTKKRIRKAAIQAIQSDPDASADAVADHIIWENRRFAGLNERTDDTTLIVLRVRP